MTLEQLAAVHVLRHLLDVNVWVALLDEAHVHHAYALAFAQKRKVRIATCPLVEKFREPTLRR